GARPRRRTRRSGSPNPARTYRGSRCGRPLAKRGGSGRGMRAWSEGESDQGGRSEQHAGDGEQGVGGARGAVAGVERVDVGGAVGAAVGAEGGLGFVDVGVALGTEVQPRHGNRGADAQGRESSWLFPSAPAGGRGRRSSG